MWEGGLYIFAGMTRFGSTKDWAWIYFKIQTYSTQTFKDVVSKTLLHNH